MVIAYVTSFVLLIIGSDCISSINSRAAAVDEKSYEVAEQLIKNVDEREQAFRTLNQSYISSYIELLDVDEVRAIAENVEEQAKLEPLSDDTCWVFGYALDQEEYKALMDTLVDFQVVKQESKDDEEAKIQTLSVKKEKVKTVLHVTDSEVEMLERIVEAEASGEDLKGRILVANVIFNRVKDDEFPDTIEKVIFQKTEGKYQFSPMTDERYWSVKISDKTIEAVQRTLQGEDYSKGALFFMARKSTKASSAEWFDHNLMWLFQHGGHEFYKNK